MFARKKVAGPLIRETRDLPNFIPFHADPAAVAAANGHHCQPKES
jgi:hypothetical protein